MTAETQVAPEVNVSLNSVLYDNVLKAQISGGKVVGLSLPGLLSALSHDAVESLPDVRPHQEHTVHMFLAQLMAIAGPQRDASEDYWLTALDGLTDMKGAWDIIPETGQCGFMQPAMPKGTKTTVSASVSDIDLLVLSKNHAVKVETGGRQEDGI